MAHSSTDSPNPFAVSGRPEPRGERREPVRSRRISLPFHMDDGQVRTVDLPDALDRPSRFSDAEFERLTLAYAEALALLGGS